MPDMQGSGVVRDLREAASLQDAEGTTLATALTQFSSATTRNGQRAQLDVLMFRLNALPCNFRKAANDEAWRVAA